MGEDKYLRFAEVDSLICDLIREYNRQALGRESSAVFEALSRARYLHAADVRPVVRGKWEYIELIDGHSMGECSNCLKVRIVDNFCPNCGADMRESKQESKQVGILEEES